MDGAEFELTVSAHAIRSRALLVLGTAQEALRASKCIIFIIYFTHKRGSRLTSTRSDGAGESAAVSTRGASARPEGLCPAARRSRQGDAVPRRG